jgi:hypothetical protein
MFTTKSITPGNLSRITVGGAAHPIVITSEARDLGICPRRQYRLCKQTPGSLASLGMTETFLG